MSSIARSFGSRRRVVIYVASALAVALALTLLARLFPVNPSSANEEAELRTVDFTVVDNAGRFVPDLRPEELEVFEDGVKRWPRFLTMVYQGRSIKRHAGEADVPQRARPAQSQQAYVGRSGVLDAGDRIIVVAIDDLSISVAGRAGVGPVLKRIQSALIRPGTVFAVLSTGPAGIVEDLTYDQSRFAHVLERIDAGVLTRSAARRIDGDPVDVSLGTLREAINAAGRLKGRRKAILVISEGYPVSRNNKAVLSRLVAPDAGLGRIAMPPSGPVRSLIETLLATDRANAIVSVFQPLAFAASESAARAPRGAGRDEPQNEWLLVLTQWSRGTLAVDATTADEAFSRLDVALTNYYIIAYESPGMHGLDRAFQQVEIRTKRRSVAVDHRPWL